MKKYNNGAKAVLFISMLAIPIQLITSMLISRVSPEAVGLLGIVELFYLSIITFFLFGGETALVKIISDTGTENNKRSFLLYYLLLCLFFYFIVVFLMKMINIDIIKVITSSNENTNILMYASGGLIIIYHIILSFYKEQGRFLKYAIGTKVFNIVCFLATILILYNGELETIKVFFYFILAGYFVVVVLSIKNINFNFSNLYTVIQNKNNKIFGYVLFLYASTIVAFLYDKIDQIILLNQFGLATLGGYYIVLKIVNMAKLIPNIYNSTFYPYLCKNLKEDNSNDIFKMLLNRNLLVIIPIVVFSIFNSDLIIRLLFDETYLEYSGIFQLFMCSVLLGSPAIILNNFLFALGKTKQYFLISSVSVLLQIILILPFINFFGVIGAVIAKVITMIITIIMCRIYIKKIKYHVEFNASYFYSTLIVVFVFLLDLFLTIPNLFKFLASLFFIILYIIFKKNEYKILLLK
ncbi:oligosaccharide flippase family protein [Paenibacillus septentrionalis]|uniref:Oligosaccharide flippase family protein n=1 Tax=Paenibacillus septentrionalis TaxID=429342 RepID=A0ABW1V6C8_9BACL